MLSQLNHEGCYLEKNKVSIYTISTLLALLCSMRLRFCCWQRLNKIIANMIAWWVSPVSPNSSKNYQQNTQQWKLKAYTKSKRRNIKMISVFGVSVVVYFIKILSGSRNYYNYGITPCCFRWKRNERRLHFELDESSVKCYENFPCERNFRNFQECSEWKHKYSASWVWICWKAAGSNEYRPAAFPPGSIIIWGSRRVITATLKSCGPAAYTSPVTYR